MSVMSLRFPDDLALERLRGHARRRDSSMSSLAAQLIEEGLRMEEHPAICFRDGPSGRRAVLIGGPEVTDVVSALVGGDVPVEERRTRVAELMGLRASLVDAALAYYAEHTDEIEAEMDARQQAADKQEQLWMRQQALLTQ